MILLSLLIAAIFAVVAFVSAAYLWRPEATRRFVVARIDFVCRWWEVAGPRLTDRNHVQSVLMNSGIVTLFAVSPQAFNWIVLAIVLAANLYNPTWDKHPDGARLGPPMPRDEE